MGKNINQKASLTLYPKRIRWLLMCGLCLFTVLIYREALSGYFLGDDLDFLYYTASWTHEGKLVSKVLREFISPQERGGFFYRPFTIFSYAADYLLWGTNPTGWHLTNLFLHLANTVLLWLVVELIGRRSGSRSAMSVGGVAALLFALRPSSPETVAWISGRPDELALLGMLISLFSYLRANGAWGRCYFLSLVGFLFSLGSKEVGVTVPAGLMALHIAGAISLRPKCEESPWWGWIREVIRGIGPFALIFMVYFALRFLVFGTPFKIYQDVPPINFSDPAWRAAKLYAVRFFLAQSISMTFVAKIFLFGTISQVLLGWVIGRRSIAARRIWVFGGCWLLAELLPLVQQLSIAPTGEGARLLYIPGAALAVVLAVPITLISPLKESGWQKTIKQPLAVAGTLSIIGLVFLTFPLRLALLSPWIWAGESMKRLPASIAARAEAVPENGFAILIIPDHIRGAVFGRNGQGTLMEPPVQAKSLSDRILVVTPPSLRYHAPRFAMQTQSIPRLECWCWNAASQQFDPLSLREHTADNWLDAWKSSLRDSGCLSFADEIGE